jgi:hypothetical protein
MRWLPALLAQSFQACAMINQGGPIVGSGAGIVMAYEVSGRVTSDERGCEGALPDVSVALFDSEGTLLDETRSDQQGKFVVGVRNPDAADAMLAKLDGDDPTVSVSLRVQPAHGGEQSYALRLPRPLHGKEYRVRLDKRASCAD